MNAQRDPEAILAAWLDEGPTDLPDATRRAILTALPTTSQARRGPFAPWRFFGMNGIGRLAGVAMVAVLVLGGLYVLGPRIGIGPSTPTPSPAPSTTPIPGTAGTVTATETGCTWTGNPGSIDPREIRIAVQNDSDDFVAFDLHRLKPEHSFEEAIDLFAQVKAALPSGGEWPAQVFELSTLVADSTLNGQGQNLIVVTVFPGVHGIVCSANTAADGDVLRVDLLGPLEVRAEASPGPTTP